jgi:rhodanese-related sulfurtransferase
LIDVRESAEHASQKISGSHLSPVGSICCGQTPKTDKKILIHCHRGTRWRTACEKVMAENDSLDVYNVDGGIDAWLQTGLPVETGGKKILPLDRQVQLTIGTSVLAFGLLGYFVNPAFSLAVAFFGAGLMNAGITGWCGLARVVAKMPWNT